VRKETFPPLRATVNYRLADQNYPINAVFKPLDNPISDRWAFAHVEEIARHHTSHPVGLLRL
jgi:hypothetical protein